MGLPAAQPSQRPKVEQVPLVPPEAAALQAPNCASRVGSARPRSLCWPGGGQQPLAEAHRLALSCGQVCSEVSGFGPSAASLRAASGGQECDRRRVHSSPINRFNLVHSICWPEVAAEQTIGRVCPFGLQLGKHVWPAGRRVAREFLLRRARFWELAAFCWGAAERPSGRRARKSAATSSGFGRPSRSAKSEIGFTGGRI